MSSNETKSVKHETTLKTERAIVRARDWLHGKSTHDTPQADISDGCKADLIKANFFIATGRKKEPYTSRYPTVLILDNYFLLGGSGIRLGCMTTSKLVKMRNLKEFLFSNSFERGSFSQNFTTISFIMLAVQFWVFCFVLFCTDARLFKLFIVNNLLHFHKKNYNNKKSK